MAMNMKLLRENINKKLGQNPEIAKELHIKNPAEFTKISDQQLEKLVSPKLLGLLSLSRKDLETKS